MQIDLDALKANGQQYVDSIIDQMKETAWLDLKASKFQNSSSEEIELLKAIWYHGFSKGAEVAIEISMAMHNAISKQ